MNRGFRDWCCRAVLLSLMFGALLGACSPSDSVIGVSVGTAWFNASATRPPDGGRPAPGAGGAPGTTEPAPLDEATRDAAVSPGAPVTTNPVPRDAGAPSASDSPADAGGTSTAPDVMPDTIPAPALCHMAFQVTTVSFGGDFAPANVGVIWVVDSSKKFVKTLKIWAAAQRDYLATWISFSKQNRVDAVTGATTASHAAKSATWNCSNVMGQPVARGLYRVYTEFTEWNGAGKVGSWEFAVGGVDPVNLMPADMASFKGVRLQLMP